MVRHQRKASDMSDDEMSYLIPTIKHDAFRYRHLLILAHVNTVVTVALFMRPLAAENDANNEIYHYELRLWCASLLLWAPASPSI